MAIIQKEMSMVTNLVGAVGGNDYYLFLPQGSQPYLTNGHQAKPIEECYINCDSSLGAINIYLPAITLFQGFWNTKIYTSWLSGGNAVTIFPFQGDETALPDNLNGLSIYSLSGVNECVYTHIVAPHIWMKLVCPPLLR